MVPNKTDNFSSENKKNSELIRKFVFGKENVLNVTTVPYNTSIIFYNAIIEYINRGKRVLYVTNEMEENIELIDYIKKNTLFRNYTFIRNNEVRSKAPLIISNHQNASGLNDWFDLVIYDDIRALSKYSKGDIVELMLERRKEAGKLIAYSIESVFHNAKEMILPLCENNMPFVEPRVITTRVDINKDIPYMVYEYLKWSMDLEKKVIIYVPNDEKLQNVFNYLIKYKKRLTSNILKHSRQEYSSKTPSSFMQMKKAIIVTDDWEDLKEEYRNIDVMVYFADDKVFDYKKFIFFCGKAGRSEGFYRGEVILLASEETSDMEKAKMITRSFNKEAWEKGLLRL